MKGLFSKKKSSGFTLIELLVVIAIIGVLASIVLVSMSRAQERGRDARRIEDIRELGNALQSYAVDFSNFPIATATTTLTGSDSVSSALVSAGVMRTIPQDPISVSSTTHVYQYVSNGSGSDYTLIFCLEADGISGRSAGCGNTYTP